MEGHLPSRVFFHQVYVQNSRPVVYFILEDFGVVLVLVLVNVLALVLICLVTGVK